MARRNWNRLTYKAHQWLGLVTGLFILLLSGTGSVLVFEEEIDRALNPYLLKVEPRPNKATLDEMLATVRAAFPHDKVRGFRNLPHSPDEVVTVAFTHQGRYWFVHLNPYTGRILGDRDADGSLIRTLLLLHYSLWVKPWGEIVVCGFGFTLLASVVTGTWIYRRSLVSVFRRPIRWRAGWRLICADLHRLVGVASLVFQAIIAATGIWILLPVFSATFSSKTAEEPRARAHVVLRMETALAIARRELPGLIIASAWLPDYQGDAITVYGRVPGNPFHSAYSSSVEIDAVSGSVRKVTDANAGTWSEQWEAMVGPLHFGNWGGLRVKVLYTVLGLSPGLLAVTGFMLWWRRKVDTRRSGPTIGVSSGPLYASVTLSSPSDPHPVA